MVNPKPTAQIRDAAEGHVSPWRYSLKMINAVSPAEHGQPSPHEGISLSKLEARRHLVVKRGWIERLTHTLMAPKCHLSPSSSSRGQGQTHSACPLTDTLFTACCAEPKITNQNPPTKDCRGNLPAAVWRLLGFSARCRQQWSCQAVTGPQTGTGHLCLGQSGCQGEGPSRTSQAV